MKVFGRKLLDGHSKQYGIDVDDIVFEIEDGVEIVISAYRAKIDGRVEIRANHGVLVVLPRAANSVEAEVRYRDPVGEPGVSHSNTGERPKV
jgi:hypothetical protein